MSNSPVIGRKKNGDLVFEGLPIVDATEPLGVKIVEMGVTDSVSRDPHNCIVARCARFVPGILDAYVGARVCYIRFRKNPGVWVRYWLGNKAAAQVHQFDETPEAVRGASKWYHGTIVKLGVPSGPYKLGGGPSQPSGRPKGVGRKPKKMARASLRNVMTAPANVA